MAGPSWLAGTFAAVMILTAAYSASRLVTSRLRGRATELDTDALHAVMGAAMAGMLVPKLHVLPGSAWAAVFGAAAAWFGWHAMPARGRGTSGSRCRYPVPHLIECTAMLYMLLPLHGARPAQGGTGMAMAGMGASAGPGSFPALAVILALFMLGHIVWTADRLATLARAKTTADLARNRGHQPSMVLLAAAPSHYAGGPPATPAAPVTRHGQHAGRPVLAPKLAACGKIAMSITMGYMLILML
ncbi:MAG TPA: DUF5134 domain-containing protein [Streptosporangiaceae bacterium]|jgi:hypothetical protein